MMTTKKMAEEFNDKDEFLRFENIENPKNQRPDICAFLILDELMPKSSRDIVSWSGHDEISLDIDCDELAKVISSHQVTDLVRCGVRYDDECLKMFV